MNRRPLLSLLLAAALTSSARADITPESLEAEEQTIRLSDGVFREYRLAVLLTKEEFESEKFGRDRNKVWQSLHALEDYLNSIYVRDLGVKFTLVQDDRLIAEDLRSVTVSVDNSTQIINERIGADSYDVGVAMIYVGYEDNGLAGLATLGGIQYDVYKGNVTSMKQDDFTVAHELAHCLGSQHTFDNGYGSEPGSGQSIAGYGFSSRTHFLSLVSQEAMISCLRFADRRTPDSLRHEALNTAPRIDRSRMQRIYTVPRNTFFSIPVYAEDEEQDSLYYSFNQWNYAPYAPAHFATLPPSRRSVLDFGRAYSTANLSLLPESDKLPVGEYKLLLAVSDVLPTKEAIARRRAPLYDCYLTLVKVVDATPFKITSTLKKEYKAGERFTLTWDVDHDFFDPDSRVRVLLSDDGGTTFRHVLVPSAPNNGLCEVVMPQTLIGLKTTYEFGGTPIFQMGRAVLRLEVIGKGLYDLSDNKPHDGGMQITASPIAFSGLPDSNYVRLAKGESLPPVPTVTARKDGTLLPVTFSESTEGGITRRLWRATDGSEEAAYAQYLEREASSVTAIGTVTNEKKNRTTDDAYYDLLGRRISRPTKGIYLHQGHKYLLR